MNGLEYTNIRARRQLSPDAAARIAAPARGVCEFLVGMRNYYAFVDACNALLPPCPARRVNIRIGEIRITVRDENGPD